MGVGALMLNGGAASLLEAIFEYNIPEWKPIVEYSKSGNTGNLTIKQPSTKKSKVKTDNVIYEWDLKLNNDVPLSLEIILGVGENNIDVSNLFLKEREIFTSIGKSVIDMGGNWNHDFNVKIHGGIGEIKLIVSD